MSSVCISNCVDDTRVPVRATYVNLYKWPESDAEFVKTVKTSRGDQGRRHPHLPHPRVVDSVSCRQMYLRSYTFSRKESVPEMTKKCFAKVRDRVAVGGSGSEKASKGGRGAYILDFCTEFPQ
ncbi:uncharacterized protein LOC108222519 [Daucus carota subsp. sativus]|uniref:uncharacterized protein LOC108222519 n=1 Tax=Daucus carota subsp. sativus TaxID=79200 RepID=UPI003083A358